MNFKKRNSNITKNSSHKVKASSVFACSIKLKEPKVIHDWVFWLEQRPHEGGRTTLLIKKDKYSFIVVKENNNVILQKI